MAPLMRTLTCTAVALLIVALAAPAIAEQSVAQEVPAPGELMFDSFARDDFPAVFAPDVVLSVSVFPSFRASHAVGIREVDGVYTIFGLQHANRPSPIELAFAAWNHQLSELEKDVESRMWTCEVRIDAALARRILRVSETMLEKNYFGDRYGLDGTPYFIRLSTPAGFRQADTWSPDRGTKPEMFADMAYIMGRVCVWNGYFYTRTLEERVQALEARLVAKSR